MSQTSSATSTPAAPSPAPVPSPAGPAAFKPYVGLASLGERDARLLAGRVEETRTITSNLRSARLTLVYGASGVGKSSLLRAGVLATLRQLAGEQLDHFGTPGFAVVFLSSWVGDPFLKLADAVQEGLKRALDVETLSPLPQTHDLVEMLRGATDAYGVELLIILDQFEEYFLYHDVGPGSFAREFTRAVNCADLRARWLVSLRDDSLHSLDRLRGSVQGLFDNRLHVKPLTAAAGPEAIMKPVAVFNELQPTGEKVEVGDGLVEAVLEQVRLDRVATEPSQSAGLNAPAEVYIDAPYMQLVMSRLWEEESARWKAGAPGQRVLRTEFLKRLGGTQAVVQQHLDKIMQKLSSRERRIAADSFASLVTLRGTKVALTPAELEEYTHHPAPEIEAVLVKLATGDNRILRTVDKKGMESSEVAYEAYHDRLATAMRDWRRRHEESRRRNRDLLVFGVVSALLVGWAVYAYWSKENTLKDFDKSLEKSDENRSKNVDQLWVLAQLKEPATKLACSNRDDELSDAAEKIKEALGLDCNGIEGPDIPPNNGAQQLPPRVYFQIQDETQRGTARDLELWLETQKYDGQQVVVPGIEYVGRRRLQQSQLRYFHANNADESKLAEQMVNLLKSRCVEVSPQLIAGYEDSDAIRPRHFELWLAPDALDNYGCPAR